MSEFKSVHQAADDQYIDVYSASIVKTRFVQYSRCGAGNITPASAWKFAANIFKFRCSRVKSNSSNRVLRNSIAVATGLY